MNNMVRGVRPPVNPIQGIRQIQQTYQRLRNNPQEVTQFLKDSGRFSEEQIKQISGMNGNFSQIGQYLISGMPQNMYGQIQQNVENIEKQM